VTLVVRVVRRAVVLSHQEEAEDQADPASDHQDDPDDLNVDASHCRRDGKLENRANRDQKNGTTDCHPDTPFECFDELGRTLWHIPDPVSD
jgi:hypothetical protein